MLPLRNVRCWDAAALFRLHGSPPTSLRTDCSLDFLRNSDHKQTKTRKSITLLTEVPDTIPAQIAQLIYAFLYFLKIFGREGFIFQDVV